MNLFFLDAASSTVAKPNTAGSMLSLISPIALMFVVLYFFLFRPQKKKDKEIRAMRDNLQIGDEVVTSGGIIGIVSSLKDDTVVIETGSDRSKVRLARWAIAQNNTLHESDAAK